LEEFGIRCVAIALPDGYVPAPAEMKDLRQKLSTTIDGEIPTERASWDDLTSPATDDALRLSRYFLSEALPSIEQNFSPLEILPVRMRNLPAQDVLCFLQADGHVEYTKPSVWWAYAFGNTEQMPKNDQPNISLNGYPWGFDVAVNAELKPSQRVVNKRVREDGSGFDALIKDHGELSLQLWLKLEHQPRIYHWIPLEQHEAGTWSSFMLLDRLDAIREDYPQLREQWQERIFSQQSVLTASQVAHMARRNSKLNLAVRFVKTMRSDDEFWVHHCENKQSG
jgi:hypothetical protein